MTIIKYIFILSFLSCSTTIPIKPLNSGEHSYQLSLAGAFFNNLGPVLFVPELSLAYRRGFDQQISVYGNVGLTSLLFGALAINVGGVRFFQLQERAWWYGGVGILNLMGLRSSLYNSDKSLRMDQQFLAMVPEYFLGFNSELHSNWLYYVQLKLRGPYFSFGKQVLYRIQKSELCSQMKSVAYCLSNGHLFLGALNMGLAYEWEAQKRIKIELFWEGIGAQFQRATLEYQPSLPTGVLGMGIGVDL